MICASLQADLIYIVGSGRSGSTVLERVLATHPDVVAVGEIHALWRLPLSSLLCSCGVPVETCAFWRDVIETAGLQQSDIDRLRDLEFRVVRHKFLARHRYDTARLRRDRDVIEFLDYQRALFEAIRATSGKRIVLDSSKAGPRGWLLSMLDSNMFLHSHRSCKQVLLSWRKPKFEPATGKPMIKPSVGSAALAWVKAEHAAKSLGRHHDVVKIELDAFAQAPVLEIERGLPDLAPGIPWVSDRSIAPPEGYHSVLGNPDRYDRKLIEISARDTDLRAVSRWDAAQIRVISSVLDRLYR